MHYPHTVGAAVLAALLLALPGVAPAQADSSFVACAGSSVNLVAPAGYDYVWTASRGGSRTTARTKAFTALEDVTYTVSFLRETSGNLVKNGDFEAGNADFTTDYRYVPGGTFDRGTYAILTNPGDFNRGFRQCLDSAIPGGRMLVADGSEVNGAKAWCQRVPVNPNRRYAFQVYLTSLVGFNPPRLVFTINGARLGEARANTNTCEWQQFYTIWESPNVTTAEICVVNNNTIADGNDFALDRISFVEVSDLLTRSYAVTVARAASDTLDVDLCEGERYRDNGLDLAPGDSARTTGLFTSLGCDSTVFVRTALARPIFVRERTDTLCPGDVFPFEGLLIRSDTIICREGVSRQGCDSTYCLTVKFFDETALGIRIRRPSCVGDGDARLNLSILAGRPPFTVVWEDGSSDTTRTDLSAGEYTVSVTDRLGCSATRTVRIPDPPPIEITDLVTTEARCFSESNGTVVVVPTGGTGPFDLTVRDTVRAFDAQRLPQGTYVIRATDSLGCFAERPFTIGSPPPVELELRGDTLLRLGETASYRLRISGDSVFTRWDFDLRSIDSLVRANAASFVPGGSGRVRVVGTDRNGCSEEVSLALRVKTGTRPYFPSAFSPNDDRVNDRFGPVADPAIARVLNFQIFDRWGGLQFSASDCGPGDFAEACAWSGRPAGEARVAGTGTYVYVARIELIDGRIIEQSGDVTLVR